MANEAVTVVASRAPAAPTVRANLAPPPPPRPRARLSEGTIIVALMAALSVLLIVKIWVNALVPQFARIPGLEVVAPTLAPHLVLLLIVAMRYVRVGNVAAILVGSAATYFAGTYFAATRQPLFVVTAIVQVIMLAAAVYDLWSARRAPRGFVPIAHRALGVLAPVLVAAAALAMISSGRTAEAKALQTAEAKLAAERAVPYNAWMLQSVLPQVYELARCIEQSRGDSVAGPYPRSLADVPDCAAGDPHHRMYYQPPSGKPSPWRAGGFVLASEAVWDSSDNRIAVGTAGTRNFLLDSAGNVYATSERRRATPLDSSLPRCAGEQTDGRCALFYMPRQRWGVRPRLPRVAIGMGDDDLLGQETTLTLIFQAAAITDTLASLEISWADGEKLARVPLPRPPVAPRRRQSLWSPSVTVSLMHTYSDTGLKVVRAVATLRGGERYESRDTVRITPRR